MTLLKPSFPFSQSQLFLDDTWIADSAFVQRIWHPTCKFPEPVLKAEYPWEEFCPVAYGSVLRYQDKFRLWYCGWTRHVQPRLCYAESDDGVHWNKPKLGLCEFNGDKDNNIVLQPGQQPTSPAGALIDNVTVIEDIEDAAWPLKMLFWEGSYNSNGIAPGSGIYAARSRDGLHWEHLGLALPDWGDRFNALPHKLSGKYVVFGRAPGTASIGAGAISKGRSVWRSESEDLLHWSTPQIVLACDAEDPHLMQTYSLSAWGNERLLIGTMERMHMSPDVLDPEIVWSHDGGESWQRSRTRPAFIERGERGHFDDAWINLPANTPIENEGQWWFYYSGRSSAHGSSFPHNHGAIGLATLRIDGYASLEARESWGTVLSKPLIWPGGELHVNYDPRRNLASHPGLCNGELLVEVRDDNNVALEGYSWGECRPLMRNTAKLPNACEAVAWKNKKPLGMLAGSVIRFAFKFRDCHLYSFRAVEL